MSKLGDFTPDARNANKGTARGQKMIVNSIQQNGFGRSVLADKNGVLIAGNKTVEASAEVFGVEVEPIVVETDGQRPVVVKRTDLDLTDPDPNSPARRLAYQDNLTSRFSFELDPAVVMADIEAGFNFEAIDIRLPDLGEMLNGAVSELLNGQGGRDVEPQIDKADELRRKWGTELGQVWQLGEHRLACGDCTDKAVVEAVMRGERVEGIITDPPYAFGLSSTSEMATKSGGWHDIMNNSSWFVDRYKQWAKLLAHNGPMWVFGNWRTLPILMRAGFDSGFGIDSVMVWYKDWIGPGGTKALRPTYELIALTILGDYAIPDRSVEDFFKAGWSSYKPTGHRAEKPVELLDHLVGISDVQIILDPFSGSGTTLIACENLGRKCRAVEIDPGYVAVALQRWADLTGQTPVKLA